MFRRPSLWVLFTCLAWGSVGQAQTTDAPTLTEKTYQVADLVVPIRMDLDADKTEVKSLESQLMETIRSSVLPESWAGQGGLGSLKYFANGMSLVIRQTPAVHERIAKLLADLRRPQEVEVAIEVRLVSVGTEAAVDLLPDGDKDLRVLNDQQVLELLKVAQADRRTQVMQVPKFTVANGQRVTWQSIDRQNFLTGVNVSKVNDQLVFTPKNEPIETGLKYAIRPVVSADRRFVELSFQMISTRLDGPVPLIPVQVPVPNSKGEPTTFQMFCQQPKVAATKVERLLKLADGATAVLNTGKVTVVQGRCEYNVPVLSRIPCVCRLFRTVGYSHETQRLFVLITPRIVINQEEELISVGAPPR